MRVVLKPLGIVLLLGTVAALILLAVLPQRSGEVTIAVPAQATGADAWTFSQPNGDPAADTSVPATGGPEGRPCLKLLVKKANPKEPWYVQTYHNLKSEFGKGETWTLRFKARSPDVTEMQTVFELNREPYTKELAKPVALTNTWKAYSYTFLVKDGYHPGDAKIGFQVGAATGTYEIADVELVRDAGGLSSP